MNHHYSHICHLGHFSSLAEVWRRFPDGGCTGDCLWVGNHQYCWDPMRRNWLEDNYTDSDSFRLLRQTGDLDLFGNLRVGGSAVLQHHALFKGDVRIEGRLLCRHLQGHDKGLFISSEALQGAVPSPKCGDWALVADADQLLLWQCPADGIWQQIATPAGFQPSFNLEAYNNARNIVDSIAEHGYVFCGVAAPTTQPLRPIDHNIFYLSSQPGEYIHFGHMQVREPSVLMWTHDADPNGDGVPEGQWTSYVVFSSFDSMIEELRSEVTEATSNMTTTLRREMADITANLAAELRAEIASDIEDAKASNHKVRILAFAQGETPVLTSPAASALMGNMPHGVYWFNTSTNTLYEGSLSGTPPRMTWSEAELSEETLYVDRNGRKLYVWVSDDGEMREIPYISSQSGGEGTPLPGGEGSPSENMEPDPNDIVDDSPGVFSRSNGNLGGFTISGDPEDITVQDVREAYEVPLLNASDIPNGRIWSAAEVGLNENDTAGTTNASYLKAALADPTCAGIKLDKVYPIAAGNAWQSISNMSKYNSGTTSIILPRDFIFDGEGEDAHAGEAVGGFKIVNTNGNLFYTEHSLNMLYVRTESTRHTTDNFTHYVINCVNGVEQVQFIGCVFEDTEQYYRAYRCIMLNFEDQDPRGENWVPPETNRLRHFYMADCEANGSLILSNNGCMRVTNTFRIVDCEFTNMDLYAIYLPTENSNRWENVMAYMSCPLYIAGCTFQGYQGVMRMGENKNAMSVLVENSVLYMLHNYISDFVTVPKRTGDSVSRGQTYDMYFNGQQLYFCNNTVRNVVAIDKNKSKCGIMKAKGSGLGGEPMKRDLELSEITATNNRRRLRCWKGNTYELDKTEVEAYWTEHLANNDGNAVEIAYEEALDLDDVLTIVTDTMAEGADPIAEFIFENNVITTDGNVEGYGADWFPVTKVSIKNNEITAARLASEEWGHKATTELENSPYCYLFTVMLSDLYGDPEVYVEGNEFTVTDETAENVHVLLFRTYQSGVKRKPDLWPEDGKATFKNNVLGGNTEDPLIVGFSCWYVARNYDATATSKTDTYNTLLHFDTGE